MRELIEEIDEQSAYLSSQLKKLSDRRHHLQQLYQDLSAQAGESSDAESDTQELEDKE